MGNEYGWKIEHEYNIPVTLAADVTAGQVAKITATDTGNVCGSGEVPRGVYFRDVDISEDGTRGEIMTKGVASCLCAAAITDISLPVKAAASGTVTPVTSNNDIIVGYPLNTQAVVGGFVSVDLTALGTFYGV